MTNETRRALLLGVTSTSPSTSFPPLPSARDDIEAMDRVLKFHRDEISPNFTVSSQIVDSSSEWHVGKLLDAIELALEDADHFLFYFSGHGDPTPFGLQLVTPEKSHALDSGINFDLLLHRFNRADQTEITVILDCCFAGAAGDSSFAGRDVLRRFTNLRDGISILASSEWSDPSYVDRGLSEFTKELVRALGHDHPQGTDVLDLYKWTKEHVPEQSPVIRTFGSSHSAIRSNGET